MIIVTGAAGFIGSNIVAALEGAGYQDIVVCDWMGDGDKWRNLAKRQVAAFVPPEDLLYFMDGHSEVIRGVIHMGAISATTERNVDALVRNNITTSVDLWDWCALNNVPFIYASSAATYGDGADNFDDDDSPEALSKLKPLNAYGWSKKATDDIFSTRASRGELTPVQWVGLKFFNVYGPNEYHKDSMRSVACKLCEDLQENKPIKLFKSYHENFADGQQLRDFVYVKDCTNVILWFLQNPHVSGIFNLGSGKARSFEDVAKSVMQAMNLEAPIEFIDMPEFIRARYQYFTEANMLKLKEVGCDVAFHSLEDGIRDYIQNYLMQDDRYR